jgi:hypothetical protein
MSGSEKKKDWFSAPMIMAYVALLGLTATSIENCRSRIVQVEETKKKEQVNNQTHSAVVDLLLSRQDDADEKIDRYFQAILYAMPVHQHRRAERYLDSEELKSSKRYKEDSTKTTEIADLYDEEQVTETEESPKTVFGNIKQQVQKGSLPSIDVLKEGVAKRRGKVDL